MSSGRSCTGSVFLDRLSARTTTRSADTYSATPGRLATTTAPESRATTCSIPVPTRCASGCRSGTAWRCVFAPLLERRQEHDLVGDASLDDLPVGRLDEAELVRPRVGRERRDQADVRAFRRLDRADPAVVRRVDVAHLEPRPLAGEAPRTQRREAALVGQLRQRVRLIHELR